MGVKQDWTAEPEHCGPGAVSHPLRQRTRLRWAGRLHKVTQHLVSESGTQLCF